MTPYGIWVLMALCMVTGFCGGIPFGIVMGIHYLKTRRRKQLKNQRRVAV